MQKNSTIAVLPSQQVPGGVSPTQVPMFVAFTFDDNGKSGAPGSGTVGGMTFVLDLFKSRKNADGSKTLASFYNAGFYAVRGQWEDPVYSKRLWRQAFLAGHEIGNHSFDHPHGRNSKFGPGEWADEISRCHELMTKAWGENEVPGNRDDSKGPGVPTREVNGFRAPFLGYNDATFTALRQLGYAYDCSIMEGLQADQDGSNCVWPYTLDHGSPGDKVTALAGSWEPIGSHPGLWELPTYAIITPPDDLCQHYGLAPGFRSRLKARQPAFDELTGKIPGLDWNLWSEYSMTREEFVASYMYTFDQKYKGNRSPMIFCTHSDIYADDYDDPMTGANGQQRRGALKDCYDYVLKYTEVRVTTARNIMNWMKNPVAL